MTDAAEIKPKFIPDDKLRTRDNSGGLGFDDNHSGEWDDGGYIFGGAKSHLSAGGGGPGSKHKTDDEGDSDNKKFKRGSD
jgi:hypothetical protein